MVSGSFNPPLKDYKIVSAITQWGMTRQARKLMNQGGWTPLGGITRSFGILYQAFTK